MTDVTVQEILEAAASLPGRAGVLLEDQYGQKYEVSRVFAIGARTDDPGLILKIRASEGRDG